MHLDFVRRQARTDDQCPSAVMRVSVASRSCWPGSQAARQGHTHTDTGGGGQQRRHDGKRARARREVGEVNRTPSPIKQQGLVVVDQVMRALVLQKGWAGDQGFGLSLACEPLPVFLLPSAQRKDGVMGGRHYVTFYSLDRQFCRLACYRETRGC